MADTVFGRIHVLVVDDNEHMITLLSEILRSLGVREVSSARDGPTAFSMLRTRAIDLIICDWNMSPVDGLKFTRTVRRHSDSPNPSVPIIMLTAHAECERVAEARDCGVNEFLAKPVSPATILSRLKSVIEQPRAFVETEDYVGPDRRRRSRPYTGPDRRQQPATEDEPTADEPAAAGSRS